MISPLPELRFPSRIVHQRADRHHCGCSVRHSARARKRTATLDIRTALRRGQLASQIGLWWNKLSGVRCFARDHKTVSTTPSSASATLSRMELMVRSTWAIGSTSIATTLYLYGDSSHSAMGRSWWHLSRRLRRPERRSALQQTRGISRMAE